jgi:hypothetical protein
LTKTANFDKLTEDIVLKKEWRLDWTIKHNYSPIIIPSIY